MSFLRSRKSSSRKTDKGASNITANVYDDQFCDIGDHQMPNYEPQLSMGEDKLSLSSFHDDEEKAVFEQQLNTLQEQLVAAMIENQSLAQKLKLCRDKSVVDDLKQDLLKQTHRNERLERQLADRNRRRKKKKRNKSGYSSESEDSLETAVEADSLEERHPSGDQPSVVMDVLPAEARPANGVRTRVERLYDRLLEWMYDLFEDLAEDPAPATEDDMGDPLTVKTLKENIKRFKTAFKPYMDTAKGLYNLASWKSPAYTLIVFIVFMYSVWQGWLIPLLFFLGAFRIFINYLNYRNIMTRQFAFLDPGEEKDTEDKDLGLSDKFNLVLQVARKVQNGLGTAADGLEKIKNLLTWRYIPGTQKVFTGLLAGSIFSAIFSGSLLLKCAGLGLGVKVFCINFIYNTYPRLKRKYDTNYRLWLALPTDAEHEQRVIRTEMNKYIVVAPDGEAEKTVEETDSSDSDDESRDSIKELRDLFSLPPTECPQHGWMGGKRSVLIGKEKSFVALLSKKRGKLYLTNSFLCFERKKSPTPRNIVIPLCDIVSLQKVKPYAKMPGRGMAIQVMVKRGGKENVLVFGGIIGRDDVMKQIEDAQAHVTKVPSLSNIQVSQEPGSSMSSRKSSASIDCAPLQEKFTFAVDYVDSD